MKRLTKKSGDGYSLNHDNCPKQGDCYDSADCVSVLVDRLAAYEDTELTPDEIRRVHDTLLTVQKKHRIIWDDLQKFLQAEAEGRLLTLPCCIGTHLWKVTRTYRQAPKVTEYVVKNIRTSDKRPHIQLEVQAVNTPGTVWMGYHRFCKTREEASAMLLEPQNGAGEPPDHR